MTTIKEAYVSFEVAKLLKEKGFNEDCYTCYIINEIQHYDYKSRNNDLIENVISAPTQQMAMRWLREEYNLHIEILAAYHFCVFDGYSFEIFNISERRFVNYQYDKGLFKTAEDATDNAINYCLTILI